MVLKLQKIEDYQYKSWSKTSNLNVANFNHSNIIFGHNGAGKSSLAQGISKEYIAANGKDSARFFGSKFVDDTLLLEDKSGIRGVVSNFGKKDVDIEKKISSNEKEIDELTTDIAKHSKVIRDLSKDTDNIVKEIVKRRKDKNTKINNKSENKTIHEKVSLWVKDYEDSVKRFPDEDYNALTGSADFSSENEQVNLLAFPTVPKLEDSAYTSIESILQTPFISVDIPQPEVVNWVEGGLHIHEGKDKCEFCGSTINFAEIKKRIDTYLNDDRHKAIVELEDYKEALRSVQQVISELLGSRDLYKTTLKLKDSQIKFDDISINAVQVGSFIKESLDRKLGAMDTELALGSDIVTITMENLNEAVAKLDEAKREYSKNLTDKINRLELLVKGAIGFEVSGNEVINDNLLKIQTASEEIAKLTKKQDGLKHANTTLRSQKSDLADFADYLNETLRDLNLNFALRPSGKVYVLKHSDGSSLKLDDISDGERNLLSLIYFYFEMLSGESDNIKDEIDLIVVDDPISSLDDGNKFYITEIVRAIIDQRTAQTFVLTHSWNDFCNIAYGHGTKDDVTLFEIKKLSGASNINVINGTKLLTPYMMLYREVNMFRQKDAINITPEDALHMPNIMRRVLEEYVKFRVDVDFATAGKNGDISKALFGDDYNNLSNTKKQKLNKLLAICNILSHKASQPKDPSEVHDSAKFLINTIEEFDKYHHLKMRGEMS